MASIIVTRGLQVIGGRASNSPDNFAAIQTIVVDDRAVAFAAGDTTLGSPTNFFAKAATVTRSGQQITHTVTFATGEANFTIRRISLHNAVPGDVTGTSVTLCSGIDAQSLVKTANFTLTISVRLDYTAI